MEQNPWVCVRSGPEGFIAKFAVHGAEAQLSCEGEGKVRQR